MKNIPSFLLFLFIGFYSCKAQLSVEPMVPSEFQKAIQSNTEAIVLDVRTPEEYREGYILHAVNVDYKNENFKSEIAKLDTAKTYYVYCRSGGRSANAASYMKSVGFKNVYDLKGGITSWKADKFPVIQKPLPVGN